MLTSIPFSGWGLVRGAYGDAQYSGLERVQVEALLACWFAWLDDRAAVTISLSGQPLSAELRIRRWRTRPDQVHFRWRNADATRAAFSRVCEAFQAAQLQFEVELTPKTKQPRALVIALAADDVFGPASVVGLVNRAFAAAGLPTGDRYDLACSGRVLRDATRRLELVPQSRAYTTGRSLGAIAAPWFRWVRLALSRLRGRS